MANNWEASGSAAADSALSKERAVPQGNLSFSTNLTACGFGVSSMSAIFGMIIPRLYRCQERDRLRLQSRPRIRPLRLGSGLDAARHAAYVTAGTRTWTRRDSA